MNDKSVAEVRNQIRSGKFTEPTPGVCSGYAQANLMAIDKKYAFDFLLFANRNPKPCPVLDVVEPGKTNLPLIAPEADIRTDIPRYRIWKNGVCEKEVTDVTEYWTNDMVGFLLGCSFSFESALVAANVPVRHIEAGSNVPMYRTSIPTISAGPFHGNTVVSMRPIPANQVSKAVTITALYPGVHGAPLHIGEPGKIGITDVNTPDFGDPVEIREGEIPVFWACGVTPQLIIETIKMDFAITHSPGHMFISDCKDQDYQVF